MLASFGMTGIQVSQIGCGIWPGLVAGRSVSARWPRGRGIGRVRQRRRKQVTADVRARLLRTSFLSLHSTLQTAVEQTYKSASDDLMRK